MGNKVQCCSGDRPGGCCTADPKEELGVPVAPRPSTEVVVGVDPKEVPGPDGEATANADAAPEKAKEVSASEGNAPEEYQSMTYDDGSTYKGQLNGTQRHGYGIWQSASTQYEGQWKEDMQHGRGSQKWQDRRSYSGEFQSGKFWGQGKMIWHSQGGMQVYEGEYMDDMKHGHGKFVWADGRAYDGEWRKGKRHGKGMYLNARREQRMGIWADDKFERWETSATDQAGAAATPAQA